MKCVVCGQVAKWRWSPDLDILGIGSCDEHQETVQMAYSCLITGTENLYHSIINGAKTAFKKTKKVTSKVL